MAKAQNGDTVKVHYKGRLDDGTQFDSSEGKDPLKFEVGKQQVIQGFEKAVVGMEVGDSTTVKISSEEAYGPRMDEMVLKVDKTRLPEGMQAEVGQQLQLNQPDGQNIVVTITNVTESEVELDANHPLAGKDLTFDIELVEIV